MLILVVRWLVYREETMKTSLGLVFVVVASVTCQEWRRQQNGVGDVGLERGVLSKELTTGS